MKRVCLFVIVAVLVICSVAECRAWDKYPLIGNFDCDTVFQQNGIWYGIPDYNVYGHYKKNEIAIIAPWQAIDKETYDSTPIEDRNEEHYAGDVYVPDSIEFNGVVYKIVMVSDRTFESAGDLTSLRIPPIRELSQATFRGIKRLRSLVINGDVVGGEDAFGGSGIRELILTAPHFGSETYLGQEFDGLGLDLMKVERCDRMEIECCTAAKICMDVEGCEHLTLSFPFSHHYSRKGPYWAPKYMIWRGVEPPVIEVGSFFKSFRPDNWEEDCKLKNTVLFVPDESIELYRGEFFWKDFFSIHGISELDRVDEILAEVAEVRQIAPDTTPAFTIEGHQLTLMGNGGHHVEFYTFMGVCLERRTCGEGTVQLPAGTDIVVVDGVSRKISVR